MMKYVLDHKFHWNDDALEWERVDRVQEYRGHIIETLTVHDDYDYRYRHREYRTTYPNGRVEYTRINKRRGGNIKDLKNWIDWQIKYR